MQLQPFCLRRNSKCFLKRCQLKKTASVLSKWDGRMTKSAVCRCLARLRTDRHRRLFLTEHRLRQEKTGRPCRGVSDCWQALPQRTLILCAQGKAWL